MQEDGAESILWSHRIVAYGGLLEELWVQMVLVLADAVQARVRRWQNIGFRKLNAGKDISVCFKCSYLVKRERWKQVEKQWLGEMDPDSYRSKTDLRLLQQESKEEGRTVSHLKFFTFI